MGATQSVIDRLLSKVRYDHGCWEWTAAKAGGYGVIGVGASRVARAHRVAYETLVGPIPAGAVIDHLCRNPSCVNPLHLEPVTDRENLRRGADGNKVKKAKTHCHRGHLLSDDRLGAWHKANGQRWCKDCHNERERSRRARARGGQ